MEKFDANQHLKKTWKTQLKNELVLSKLWLPISILILVWTTFITAALTNSSMSEWGVYPRSLNHFLGIFTHVFAHSSWSHLINNSAPLLIAGSIVAIIYHQMAYSVFFWSVLNTGLWTWIIGRPSFHIGASGLVYALVTFVFVSGVLRRDFKTMALSALMVFLYGGMIWGIFPIDYKVSWEAHLSGSLAGAFLAWYYRQVGPTRKKYEWEDEVETEDDEDDENAYWKIPDSTQEPKLHDEAKPVKYIYHIKPKK